MKRLLRRFGRWLCRYDLEPVRAEFEYRIRFGLLTNQPDKVAHAISMLRILDGRDPADVSYQPAIMHVIERYE